MCSNRNHFKYDPEELLAGHLSQWHQHTRLVVYVEAEEPDGHVVGALLYEAAHEPFGESHVYRRLGVFADGDLRIDNILRDDFSRKETWTSDPAKLIEAHRGYNHQRVVASSAGETAGLEVAVVIYDAAHQPFDEPTVLIRRRYEVFTSDRGDFGHCDFELFNYHPNPEAAAAAEQAEREEREAQVAQERADWAAKVQAAIDGGAELIARPVCPECGHDAEEDEFEERLYTCSRCGQSGRGEDGRRCQHCNIFCAKEADMSCPSCEEALDELGSVEGYEIDGRFETREQVEKILGVAS